MGKQMSIRELRAALSRIEYELAEHGEIEVTRNGVVVGKFTAADLENIAPFTSKKERRDKRRAVDFDIVDLVRQSRGRY